MIRLFHICLLLTALIGLTGQSTAIAMAPATMSAGSVQAAMAGMDCMDMAYAPVPGKSPCQKMTFQCMTAMGCAPLAIVEPVTPSVEQIAVHRDISGLSLAARLRGRSYGPEPDPPSFLI